MQNKLSTPNQIREWQLKYIIVLKKCSNLHIPPTKKSHWEKDVEILKCLNKKSWKIIKRNIRDNLRLYNLLLETKWPKENVISLRTIISWLHWIKKWDELKLIINFVVHLNKNHCRSILIKKLIEISKKLIIFTNLVFWVQKNSIKIKFFRISREII